MVTITCPLLRINTAAVAALSPGDGCDFVRLPGCRLDELREDRPAPGTLGSVKDRDAVSLFPVTPPTVVVPRRPVLTGRPVTSVIPCTAGFGPSSPADREPGPRHMTQ